MLISKKYELNMITAQRMVNLTPTNWNPEYAGVPRGSVGVYGCCQSGCGRVNDLVLYHGEYIFKHLRCDCGHIMCQQCCSETVKFDVNRELRADPGKVPSFEVEAPYFSLCPCCGLTYRAQARNSTGIFSATTTCLRFKPWGTPCDYCNSQVSSQWPRVSLIATEYGVSTTATPPEPGILRSATANLREAAARPRSILRKSATGSLRAIARMIPSKTSTNERGETFVQPILDRRNIPGATHQRHQMDRDHNIPHDWEVMEYDGDEEVYTYRDGIGKLHRTWPGNRYGPYIDLY